ncbi:hypothetical protein Lepto7375DRAFT_7426 [Leptolyngbya sp. PCC 7375]|nr:hypothetical protein Lepto7375DRAFT_7426 [Leptolyngbya sp. PCC 7375]
MYTVCVQVTQHFRHTPRHTMTVTPATPQSITTIKSELTEMVNTLQTANTYQQALRIWQSENGSLTEDEINQVMGIAKPAADPFGEQIENAGSEFDPFG